METGGAREFDFVARNIGLCYQKRFDGAHAAQTPDERGWVPTRWRQVGARGSRRPRDIRRRGRISARRQRWERISAIGLGGAGQQVGSFGLCNKSDRDTKA